MRNLFPKYDKDLSKHFFKEMYFHYITKSQDVMFNTDQKHKQNKIDLTTVIHNYWPIIQNLSSSPPTYTLVPLPVMQRKLSGSGLGAW